jgi:hypothetical protein
MSSVVRAAEEILLVGTPSSGPTELAQAAWKTKRPEPPRDVRKGGGRGAYHGGGAVSRVSLRCATLSENGS